MLITYLGALKAWFYNAIFAIWPPDTTSLTLPTTILGAFTFIVLSRPSVRDLFVTRP